MGSSWVVVLLMAGWKIRLDYTDSTLRREEPMRPRLERTAHSVWKKLHVLLYHEPGKGVVYNFASRPRAHTTILSRAIPPHVHSNSAIVPPRSDPNIAPRTSVFASVLLIPCQQDRLASTRTIPSRQRRNICDIDEGMSPTDEARQKNLRNEHFASNPNSSSRFFMLYIAVV